MEYEFERYVCSKETLESTLSEFGVAIIPGVLDESECDRMVDGMWDFLEYITGDWEMPLCRSNPESWRGFYRLYPLHSMLLQYFGVGHAQASWDVRQNVKVVDVFASFWGCSREDLLVSFDGFSFGLPPERTNRGWNRNNVWYHTDQSYTKSGFRCVQSWVTGLDVDEYDATLSVMEGSHRYHSDFRREFGVSDKADWYKLSKEEEAFYVDRGCQYRNIRCPRGSMVFWDSRTIHCGVEASKNRAIAKLRAVIYVCYMPRSICSDKNLKKKQKAFEDLRTTSHYPCDIKLFAKMPRTYGGEVPVLREVLSPELSELGRRLAGF